MNLTLLSDFLFLSLSLFPLKRDDDKFHDSKETELVI